MAVNTYIPDANKFIIHKTKVDFVKRIIQKPIHLVQYDNVTPIVEIELLYNGVLYELPYEADLTIRWGKRDKTYVIKKALGLSEDRTKAYFEIDNNMTALDGIVEPVVSMSIDNNVCASSTMNFVIDRNPVQRDDILSVFDDFVVDEIKDSISRLEANVEGIQQSKSVEVGSDYQKEPSDQLLTGGLFFQKMEESK